MKQAIERGLSLAVTVLINEKVLMPDALERIRVERTRDRAHGDFASNIASVDKPWGIRSCQTLLTGKDDIFKRDNEENIGLTKEQKPIKKSEVKEELIENWKKISSNIKHKHLLIHSL